MFIHNIIKINYTRAGYLPNYPYHLISDKEMFDAFLKEDGFFANVYPCPDDEFTEAYDLLLEFITSQITKFLSGDLAELPKWIYSYMLGNVTGPDSITADINDIVTMCGIEVPTGLPTFDKEVAQACYNVSCDWILKYLDSDDKRPPTMFGEPHVLKSMRLTSASI